MKNESSLTFELSFCAWNPGVHGKDILLSGKDCMTFKEWSGKEADRYFDIDGQGWRDVWNWIDTGMYALRNTEEIDGIVIDRSTPITFGPYTDQESVIDLYPYWIGWISFKTKMPIIKNSRIEELL